MSVSIVIPCYRSSSTLTPLVSRINQVMTGLAVPHEVILVVDGSPDDTWEVARKLAADEPAVRAVQLARNYGQHNALLAGIRLARYPVTITMDDDLQHPPEEIPVLLRALTDDLDLVYGVPANEEHGFARSFASRLVKAGLAGATGARNAKMLSALRVFRTFLRDGFEQIQGPYVSVDVALSWGTARVSSAQVRMDKRRDGRSGYTFKSLVRHAINLVIGYSTAPLRLVTYFGLLTGAVGVALAIRALWLYFDGATTVAGFTTLVTMVAIFCGAQMIGIGVLGEYLGRIHFRGMGRPSYVVRDDVRMVTEIDDATDVEPLVRQRVTR
ncbi:glycosyl transferase [Rhizocola hellebori]|uniref:Glycosyl transferase n=1 Tax=Rhizocola hellebori TaxID=1392758 RepID=A0A8J3QH26_9ACTN|nr:glycosyltransferase family 2 protein [Rhizocola hellebori]GIH10486.1 glycosyl transferase [Rhizocola hellebori]